MPDFRRIYQPGGTYFFTLVTARRAPWLTLPTARKLLRTCFQDVRREHPFTIQSFVLLPDHLHTIWKLPAQDDKYSLRWGAIKSTFTRAWLANGGAEQPVFMGQAREGRRGVWQPRFMEHTIRDEDDFIEHVHYIHYNPVKHGLVRSPRDWPYSTFHKFVKRAMYPINWATPTPGEEPPQFTRVNADLLE